MYKRNNYDFAYQLWLRRQDDLWAESLIFGTRSIPNPFAEDIVFSVSTLLCGVNEAPRSVDRSYKCNDRPSTSECPDVSPTTPVFSKETNKTFHHTMQNGRYIAVNDDFHWLFRRFLL